MQKRMYLPETLIQMKTWTLRSPPPTNGRRSSKISLTPCDNHLMKTRHQLQKSGEITYLHPYHKIYQAYEIAATSHQSTLSTGLPASEQTTDVVQRPISQLEKIRPQVLNLSKQTLTQHQIKLLTRGPKFCPTTKDRTRIKDRHTTERSETYVPYPVHQT